MGAREAKTKAVGSDPGPGPDHLRVLGQDRAAGVPSPAHQGIAEFQPDIEIDGSLPARPRPQDALATLPVLPLGAGGPESQGAPVPVEQP